MHPSAPALAALWSASSIAIIGATEREGAMGRLPVEYLQRFGYAGRIFPVNPKGGSVLGLPAYESVVSINQPIDLALIMVPATAVHDAVEACAQAGVRVAIVMSSGFAETGPEGAAAQLELVDIARAGGMRLVGPNCIGAVGGADRVLATFSPVFASASTPLPGGPVALVSQSGALGFGALSLGLERGVPIGIAITTGNEADVTASEVAAALAMDENVRALAMYVESLDDLEAIRAAAQEKPVVMLKAGRSDAGAKAAASHTGALASADKVVDAALRQAGIARVNTIDDLLDAAALLALDGRMHGDRIGIVTTSGGSGILAADAIEVNGLQLAELASDTVQDLEAIVPSYGNATNPVDVTAAVMAEPGLFERCVERLADDPSVDAIVACFAVLVGDDVTRIARALQAVRERTGLPVVAARTGAASLAPEGAAVLAAAGVPVYSTPERAVAALAALRVVSVPARERAIRSAVTTAVPTPGASEKEVKALLAKAGVPIPESFLTSTLEEARAALTSVGGRCVLKAVVPGLLHKSDAGGVIVGVTEETLAAGFTQVAALGGRVLVERMVPGGVEVIVGLTPSPLGRVLTVGVGGVLTEIVADAAVRVLPVDAQDVSEMIESTALSALLAGARGAPPADRAALIDAVLAIVDATCTWPSDGELDINPITVLTEGAWVLDAMFHVPEENVSPMRGH
ncbi:MAG: acetate--CoA ligase family protein [Candidatus Nanopelagicales bacterium]|nr:acetate--CoA ligase family protein [Candidatus Nanopelagicales bacterium]